MVITYAKLWPPFTAEVAIGPDAPQLFNVSRLLYFDPVLERSGTTSVAQRLRSVDPAARECELLIVRGLSREDFVLTPEDLAFIQRLTNAESAYLLLGGPPKPYLAHLFGSEKKDADKWLPALRQLEFEAVIQ